MFLGVSKGVAMKTERREPQRGKTLVKGVVREMNTLRDLPFSRGH